MLVLVLFCFDFSVGCLRFPTPPFIPLLSLEGVVAPPPLFTEFSLEFEPLFLSHTLTHTLTLSLSTSLDHSPLLSGEHGGAQHAGSMGAAYAGDAMRSLPGLGGPSGPSVRLPGL